VTSPQTATRTEAAASRAKKAKRAKKARMVVRAELALEPGPSRASSRPLKHLGLDVRPGFETG
jgi:hypothetical protein